MLRHVTWSVANIIYSHDNGFSDSSLSLQTNTGSGSPSELGAIACLQNIAMKRTVIITAIVLLVVATTGGDERIMMRPQMAGPAARRSFSTEDTKWTPWTPCTKTCGYGMQSRVKTCGGVKCGVMEAVCADFPCNGPYTGQKWSKCTKRCGGGERFRESKYHNETQKMLCNTHDCGRHYGQCKADLVFILDSSSSIGLLDWFKTKQFAIDVVKGLQIGRRRIQVGAILYSPDVQTAFSLVKNPTKPKLLNDLWNMPYLSGTTNTAGGLRRMKKMFDDFGRPGVAHIAVLITDGQSNIDVERTVPDAAAAKAAGIDLYVVAIGMSHMTEITAVASKPTSKYVYSVNTAGDLSRLTRIITKETCPNPRKCRRCRFSGPCDAKKCGVKGKRPRQRKCFLIDSYNGKKIAGSETTKKCRPVACSFKCPINKCGNCEFTGPCDAKKCGVTGKRPRQKKCHLVNAYNGKKIAGSDTTEVCPPLDCSFKCPIKKCGNCEFSGPCDAKKCGVTGKRPRQKKCHLVSAYNGKKIAGSDSTEVCPPLDCSFKCPIKKCGNCEYSGPCDATVCEVIGKRPEQRKCYLVDADNGNRIAGSDSTEVCPSIDCSFDCPETTTVQAELIPPEEVMCTMADYTAGRIWKPHPRNCHMYFVCQLVYHSKFRMHGIDCGKLYWHETLKLCFKDQTGSAAGCKDVPIVTLSPPIVPPDATCANDLQLLLNFETGFDDVSCHKSPVIQHGGGVTRVNENGNMVACFDGSSFLEVPSVKAWFASRVVSQVTIGLWYKRTGGGPASQQGGLVSNGGCLATDSGVQVTSGYQGAYAGVTSASSFPPGLKQLFAVTSSEWHHVVMVYNGFYVKLYLDGFLRETAPATGFMLNTNSMFTVGRLCTYKYFTGCIDNVRVYGRALSDAQVFALK